VHSQVLQDVLKRLDTSFVNFFEGRTKYPHTKNYVSSITYPQASQKWIYKNSITLPKIGRVRMDGKAQGSKGQGENCNGEEI